jgi:hypothetical protein
MRSDYPALNRRHFLKHAVGFSAGLAIPGMHFVQGLKANAQALKKENKSLIILWMGGGPPTIDIWDLKPGAETGGPFKEIQTAAPGVKISEHMPKVAKQFKNLSIIRSLKSNEGDHNRGTMLMNTGHVPSPVVQFPSIGSVASHQLTPKDLDLPGFISVGHRPARRPRLFGHDLCSVHRAEPRHPAGKHSAALQPRHGHGAGRAHPPPPAPVLHRRGQLPQ